MKDELSTESWTSNLSASFRVANWLNGWAGVQSGGEALKDSFSCVLTVATVLLKIKAEAEICN